ncbi:MAG: 1-deoxy-D-xylulose-5-phosphate reductoisomerase [Desulfobacterales bacterium]|nr:1-deoxy-D-xylulose-5-phosphate reductoisomerase [Desulfobacterales bacterium]
MTNSAKALAVLGSTGSIGRSTLKVVKRFPERFKIKALTAGRNIDLLGRQIAQFSPEVAVVMDAAVRDALWSRLGRDTPTELLWGQEGFEAAARHPDVETVVTGIVGAAGLMPTLAAIEAGKDIALANKETLVMAGEIVMARAAASGSAILPVDSEHSAIFQSIGAHPRKEVRRIYLTASGGPFRSKPASEFPAITPNDALAHPNWDMGPKITIDSATLMNKGLEFIEARFLFDLAPEDIEVVVHPQSIVHSMVAFVDGAIIAQLGMPDMQGPIAYALSYPERLPLDLPLPVFTDLARLTFEAPDQERFPCLRLALEACAAGGTLPAVLNAANETVVYAFLEGRLDFPGIAAVIADTLKRHDRISGPTIADIRASDRWARETAAALVARRSI